MSISSEISRISGNVSDSLAAVAAKGVTVPTGSNSDDLAGLIAQISSGGTGAISIVDTADSGGGTVRTITAVDISDTTAAAADVASGKYFYTADGTKTQGSVASKSSSDLTASNLTVNVPAGLYSQAASKTLTDENLIASNIKNNVSIFGVLGSYTGGGGGLTYETGTYTPASDTSSVDINFTNTHQTMPLYVLMFDTSKTHPAAANYIQYFSITNFDVMGSYISANPAGTTMNYSRCVWGYTTSNSNTVSGLTQNNLTGTANSALEYWLSTSWFKAYTNSSSRYWKSGTTYKWIAVWAPTT